MVWALRKLRGSAGVCRGGRHELPFLPTLCTNRFHGATLAALANTLQADGWISIYAPTALANLKPGTALSRLDMRAQQQYSVSLHS
jgi:hypothetical protein